MLQAGMRQNEIAYRLSRIENAKPSLQIKAYGWLVGFKDVYVAAYIKARGLATQDYWDALEAMSGQFNMSINAEWRKYNDAIKDMRKQWRNRPDILLKHKRPKKD